MSLQELKQQARQLSVNERLELINDLIESLQFLQVHILSVQA